MKIDIPDFMLILGSSWGSTPTVSPSLKVSAAIYPNKTSMYLLGGIPEVGNRLRDQLPLGSLCQCFIFVLHSKLLK